MPFIGVAEPEITRGAGATQFLHLPSHHLRLRGFAVLFRIESELGDHQRPVPRDHLKVPDVSREVIAPFQEDVERNEVGVARNEIFRGRIIRVGHGQPRRFGFRDGDEVLQKRPDPRRPHPAHQGLVDLVANQETGRRRTRRASRRAVCATRAMASRRADLSARKSTCCVHGTPASSRRPDAAQACRTASVGGS